MGVWQIGTDTLAQSRFTVSALAETIANLHILDGRAAAPGRRAHSRAQIAAYRERLAADPVVALFVRNVVKANWMPDFMSPPPSPEDRTFHDELRSVRQTPPWSPSPKWLLRWAARSLRRWPYRTCRTGSPT